MRQINQAGVDLITSIEGFSPNIYNDAGHPAIGFGHDIQPGEHFDEPMTREQAIALFEKDVTWREVAVEALILVDVTDNQFAALVSLAYNIGLHAFEHSTVLRKLNVKDYQGAAEAFKMWNLSQRKIHANLVARREKEIALFNKVKGD